MSITLRLRGAAAVLAATVSLAQAEVTTGPKVLPGTHGSVVIGDIRGLIDNSGALARRVNPEVNPGQMRQMAGAMFGDPELSGLPAGSGMAVVFPQEGSPVAFLEVTDEKRPDYRKALEAKPMGVVGEAEGLLVLAGDEDSLKSAKALASGVKSDLLKGKGAPTLSASVRLADLIKKHNDKIQHQLQQMKERSAGDDATTASAAQSDVVAIYMRIYLTLAGQIELFNLTVEPSEDALDIGKAVQWKTPSNTTERAVTGGRSGSDLLNLLPETGAIRGEMDLNPQVMTDMTLFVMEELAREGGFEGADDTAAIELMKSFPEVWTGATAMTFMAGPDGPLSGAYALAVRDEAAALRLIAKTPEVFKDSSFVKFYERMGMKFEFSFEENVRQHENVSIHRLNTNMDITTGVFAQQPELKEIMDRLDYDVAVLDNTLLYSASPYRIEELIDAVRSGRHPSAKNLQSRQSLPAGGRLYIDYNIGEALKSTLAFTPQSGSGTGMLSNFATTLEESPPLLIGGYSENGKVGFNLRIHAETIQSFVQAGKKAAAEVKASNPSADKSTTAGVPQGKQND